MKELEKEFEAIISEHSLRVGDGYLFALNNIKNALNSAYQMGSEADKWISVGDGLPKEDCYIWAHSSISGEDERVWFEPELSQAFKNSHSHWMPLPKPPKNK